MGIVQIGVPMVLGFGLLTFLLVRQAAPPGGEARSAFTRSPESMSRGVLSAPSISAPSLGAGAQTGLGMPAAPASGVLVFPKAPAPNPPPAPVDSERVALQELEELRVVVWQADRIARARIQGTNVAFIPQQTTVGADSER